MNKSTKDKLYLPPVFLILLIVLTTGLHYMRAQEFTSKLLEAPNCHFVTSCVDCNDPESLEYLVDNATEISYSEFISYVPEEELEEYFPMYNWNSNERLQLETDYAVSFYKGLYQKKPAVYVQHSAIEYIWVCDNINEDHNTNIDFDRAYDSFVNAEMTGVDAGKDGSGHYIRTYGANKKTDPVGYKKGSSAYGPTQINKKTAKDYATRYPKKFKDIKGYMDKYDKQGAQQLKYGREPNKPGYDKRYDYGGKGDLSTPEYHEPYKKMAKTMMHQMDKELKSTNPKAGIKDLVQRWRGKSQDQDERYYKDFFDKYNQQNQNQK